MRQTIYDLQAGAARRASDARLMAFVLGAMLLITLTLLNLFGGARAAMGAPACKPITNGQAPQRSFSLHTSGGIAGFDDWIVIGLDGQVCVQRDGMCSLENKLSKQQIASLRQAFKQSGFFGWKAAYKSSHPIADGMTRTLVYDDGKQRHKVSVSDEGNGPAAFSALAAQVQAATIKPFSHAATYQWVSGQLRWNDLEGGFWTLVYQQGSAKKDKYGGKFVLTFEGKPPSWLKDGQMVLAYGGIKEDMVGIHMSGTYYEVTRINKQ